MKFDWRAVMRSKGVWGGLIGTVGGVAQLGLHLSNAQTSSLVDTLTMAVTIGGTLFGLYGRIVATQRLLTTSPVANPQQAATDPTAQQKQ